ncbi:hypothetical protein TIFTF001_048273 [Ficus carica]|uniref:Uncharacterized protein n=1 Tax=Ficus carica TaxID=3494 RepID=A0AA88DCK6_FICCA|nr:hypothetical protein TIFTF001_048272 [Ficus carica]GMN33619.1 hypothetical protein TIFTF001_048273 [Ficus carica]
MATTKGARVNFAKDICKNIMNGGYDLDEFPISIFRVPTSLSSSKPEAYVPQLVGLGPYHHFRPKVQQTQTYKLVEIFGLLCCHGISRDYLVQSEFLSKVVESAGRRLARDTMSLRDAMVLENQIPIHALKVILLIEIQSFFLRANNNQSFFLRAIQIESFEIRNESPVGSTCVSNLVPSTVEGFVSQLFPLMLLGFCKVVSPLDVLSDYPLCKALKHSHLLDLLYHLITLNVSPDESAEEEEKEGRFIQQIINEVVCTISHEEATSGAALTEDSLLPEEFEDLAKLIEGLLGLPWSQFCSTLSSAVNAVPFVEEALIPKASKLHKAEIEFCPDNHITRIRNLVAYEAMIKSESEPLIFTRYIELMSKLVESSEDVRVLKKVIQYESMKDEDVAKLFSGMSKSIRATNTPDLDKQIAAVNDFYNGLWKVSASNFIKKWRGPTWSYCKVLGAFLVLLFMAVQAFCSVYGCHRLSFDSNSSKFHQGFQVLSFRIGRIFVQKS